MGNKAAFFGAQNWKAGIEEGSLESPLKERQEEKQADRMRLWKSGGYGILDIEWIPDRSGETGGACLWQNM